MRTTSRSWHVQRRWLQISDQKLLNVLVCSIILLMIGLSSFHKHIDEATQDILVTGTFSCSTSRHSPTQRCLSGRKLQKNACYSNNEHAVCILFLGVAGYILRGYIDYMSVGAYGTHSWPLPSSCDQFLRDAETLLANARLELFSVDGRPASSRCCLSIGGIKRISGDVKRGGNQTSHVPLSVNRIMLASLVMSDRFLQLLQTVHKMLQKNLWKDNTHELI
jgi:hypothetical protein